MLAWSIHLELHDKMLVLDGSLRVSGSQPSLSGAIMVALPQLCPSFTASDSLPPLSSLSFICILNFPHLHGTKLKVEFQSQSWAHNQVQNITCSLAVSTGNVYDANTTRGFKGIQRVRNVGKILPMNRLPELDPCPWRTRPWNHPCSPPSTSTKAYQLHNKIQSSTAWAK